MREPRSAQVPPLQQSSLIRASLNIGRVLADRDGVTFRAQGTCMYPTLRPGDVLRIRSCAAGDVAVGDIAVCRAPQYLFSHRVIGAGERDGRAYIVTRPDRSRAGGDAPTLEDDLLGVVVSIERDGRSVPLQPTAYSWPLRLYHRGRLAGLEAKPRARLWASALAARVQERAAYRWAARRWYARRRPRLRFTVRVPVAPTLGEAVYRELDVGDFTAGETWHGRPVERWTLAAHMDSTRAPAAWVTFAHDRDGSWRATESYVRVRYRGTGLDDALLRQAETILVEAERAG
jgi:hypothetical protein